jgi:Fe-S-cluster containining protein
MQCRLGCGACCISPSISSVIPGMENGKRAGERCVQLDETNLCKFFGKPQRPKVCLDFKACDWICSDNNETAFITLTELELSTK